MKLAIQSVKQPCHIAREECWTLLRDSCGSDALTSMNIEWLMDRIETDRRSALQ